MAGLAFSSRLNATIEVFIIAFSHESSHIRHDHGRTETTDSTDDHAC